MRAGRALGAAPRRRGQGHRPRRLRPQPAPARDAERQDLPQHGRARPHQVASTSSAARALQGVHARHHRRRHPDASSRIRSTARRSTTSRSWRSTRCTMSASRWRSCSPTDPHVAEEAAQLIDAEYEELPAVFDEVEAMTSKAIVHDELKPAGTFPDLKHLEGQEGHQRRARLPPAPRRRGRRSPRPITCSSTRSARQQVLHVPLEPFVSVAEPTRDALTIHTASQSAVVRAHRDRAAARLAGEQGAGEGAVSRRRLRRQALHQARSAGRGAGAARRAGR